jgi:hypothetical protein
MNKQTRHCHWTPEPPPQGNPVVTWTQTTTGPKRPEVGKLERKFTPITDLNRLRQRAFEPAIVIQPFMAITAPVFTDTPKTDVSEVVDKSLAYSQMAQNIFSKLAKRKKVKVVSYD